MSAPVPEPLAAISADVVDLLGCGAIMYLATRDARLWPECETATAARAEVGGDVLIVYISTRNAAPTLANIEDNGQLALTATRVSDSRSVQLKGVVVAVRQADDADRAYLEPIVERRELQLAAVGLPRSVSRCLNWWPSLAIELRVGAIFEQTPGPKAGLPFGAEAR